MYQILYNGAVFYDPRLEDYALQSAVCRLGVSESGSMSLVLPPTHPYNGHIAKMSGVFDVISDGVSIFRGRALTTSSDFWKSESVEIEGLLAYLNDSVIPPHSFPDDWADDADYNTAAESGNVVQFYLNWLISQHNAQVSTSQQISLGSVTVTDQNNYISRSCESYNSTWDVVKDRLLESNLGGYLLTRFEESGTYIDYVSSFDLANTQSIEYGENLIDLKNESDASVCYSAILPIGADGLTIAGVDDGTLSSDLVKSGNIIYSISARSLYGNITKIVTWDDVTLASNLVTKASAELASNGIPLLQTITASAVDLSLTDDDVAQLRVGRVTQVTSSPHNLSTTYPLMQLNLDIIRPSNTTITLGASEASYTEQAHRDRMEVQNTLDIYGEELNEFSDRITGVYDETQTQITSAIQTSEAIIMSALEEYVKTGDFDTYRETVSTQLEQNAEEIRLSISSVTESIENVNGDLQDKYNAQLEYFRFTVDGLEIGKSGSSLKLTLDNDRISFVKNGLEIAYWDGNFLHTGNIEVTVDERAQFGNFAFIPRSDGSLKFLKVGGD